MSWLARNKEGNNGNCTLNVFEEKPELSIFGIWITKDPNNISRVNLGVELPSDADEKLIGRHISWKDEPIEL